jgi:hypothetical protein
VLPAGAERLAPPPAGQAAGRLQGAMPRAGRIGPGHVLGAGHRRRPIGAAPVFDAWFVAAKRRKEGDKAARFPRRRRALVPIRWYTGTFRLRGRVLRLPTARGCAPVVVRLDRDPPYPADQVRSVTLLYDAGRLWIDVTAEVPIATLPRRRGTGSGPAGRGRPGDHPPVCRGRAGRAVAAGVGARDPRRVPPAPARREGPRPRCRPASTQARATRVAALAAAPPPPAAGGGPTQAADQASTARGCQGRGEVGYRAPGWRAGGRRPPAAFSAWTQGGGTTSEFALGASGI